MADDTSIDINESLARTASRIKNIIHNEMDTDARKEISNRLSVGRELIALLRVVENDLKAAATSGPRRGS